MTNVGQLIAQQSRLQALCSHDRFKLMPKIAQKEMQHMFTCIDKATSACNAIIAGDSDTVPCTDEDLKDMLSNGQRVHGLWTTFLNALPQ